MALEAVKSQIRQPLAAVESVLEKVVESVEEPQTRSWMAYFNQKKGHRLRPMLAILAYYCFMPLPARLDHQPEDPLIQLAACLELIHTASLIHDDVIDNEAERRGQAALNRLQGNKEAILIGNVYYLKAFRIAFDLPDRRLFPAMTETAASMCSGEIIQSEHLAEALPESLYLDIIRRKTASLISFCCESGALLAGATAGQASQLAKAGLMLGYLYQLRDDLKDWDVHFDQQVNPRQLASRFFAIFQASMAAAGGQKAAAAAISGFADLIMADLVQA